MGFMHRPEIKLVALDLDGTILDSRGKIAAGVKESIGAARQQGVVVTIATGRRLLSTQPFAEDLGIYLPLVVHNGAVVLDPWDGALLEHLPLKTAQAELAVELGREYGLSAVVADNFLESEYFFYDDESKDTEMSAFASKAIGRVESLLPLKIREPLKVMFVDSREKIRRMLEPLQKALAAETKIIVYGEETTPRWGIEVFHQDSSKAHGVEIVARRYGFRQEEILAMGDDFNDLEMVEYAGIGVAMGNGVAAVRAAADFVSGTNDEGGVASAIEKYVLPPGNKKVGKIV